VSDALPKAYSAFAPILERLSAPLLQVLYGQLEQFERLVRDLDPLQTTAQGEFQGLGGLTQRGDLSHIVQSELLLRTEAPLEFLRRLAESETVYLEKQYADPGARTVYRVMISTGPGMLGHGRIIALAALFFMARLATARGGDFHWCFLPRTEGAVWFDEVSVNSVKRLLRAASYREMTLADTDEAAALWARLATDARPNSDPAPVDWMIGARPWRPTDPGPRGRSDAATELAANTLSFSLCPPVAGEPRAAELRLRQGGRERSRTIVAFPEDMVCLGALKTPFRPLTPAPRPPGLPVVRREPSGWAPQYLVLLGNNMQVIRTGGGLLILCVDRKQNIKGRWFAALPPHLQLVGLKLNAVGLSIAVHDTTEAREVLRYGHFGLETAKGQLADGGVHAVPVTAAHLFRRQPPYALPPLTVGRAVRFHSTSGRPFELEPSGNGQPMTFTPLYKNANILHSTGRHDVFRLNWKDETILRVMRTNGERLGDYHGGVEADAGDLREIVYTHAERTLAFSRAPHNWTLAFPGSTLVNATPQPFVLKPYETLLSAKAQPNGALLRLWSDARHGGDGEVRTVRLSDGQMTKAQQVVGLGNDALNIAKVTYGDDGTLWALTIDGQGAPAELLTYRRQNDGRRITCLKLDLEHQIQLATPIDLGKLHV
jgi:hypothetical protein